MVPFPLPVPGGREAIVSARSLHRLLGALARVLASEPIPTMWSVQGGRRSERAMWFHWWGVARPAGRPVPHQVPHQVLHQVLHHDPHERPWEYPRTSRFASRRPCS